MNKNKKIFQQLKTQHSKLNTSVYVILGSKSDAEYGQAAVKILEGFSISVKLWFASAHRSPEWLDEVLRKGEKEGVTVYICAAGGAAHLPGVVASKVSQPVIGVGIPAKYLNGFDSLLSLVQMPSGIPVAVAGLGETGMKNSAYFAAQILAVRDKRLTQALKNFRQKQAEDVKIANQK